MARNKRDQRKRDIDALTDRLITCSLDDFDKVKAELTKARSLLALNDRLAEVRSEADMADVVNKVIEAGYSLRMARGRSYHLASTQGKHHPDAYSFTDHPHKPGYCHYLIDDSVSSGTCRWENLHGVIEIV